MLKDEILVAEQPLTWQLKRSPDFQLSTFALTELDGRLERLSPINWLVMSALFQKFAKIWIRGAMAVGSIMLRKDLYSFLSSVSSWCNG